MAVNHTPIHDYPLMMLVSFNIIFNYFHERFGNFGISESLDFQ